MTAQQIWSGVLIGTVLVSSLGYVWYASVGKNCLVFESGNARVVVKYPPFLTNVSYLDDLRLKRVSDSANSSPFVFGIDSDLAASPVDSLLKEQGPIYTKTMFNGYEGFFASLESGNDDYLIPVGTSLIHLFYDASVLSPTEQAAGEKMMENIRFSTTSAAVNGVRIMKCSFF